MLILVLGAMNLLLASGLYYGAWWRIEPKVRVRILIHSPLPGVDMKATASQFLRPRPGATPHTPSGPMVTPEQATTREIAQVALFYGPIIAWVLTVTLAICFMALAAGAMIGRLKTRGGRLAIVALCMAALGAAGWRGIHLWSHFERWVPEHWRLTVGVVATLFLMIGLLARRRARGFSYLAAFTLILSAVASAVGLRVGAHFDAVAPEYATLSFIATVFAIQSAWGWVLLLACRRIPRM